MFKNLLFYLPFMCLSACQSSATKSEANTSQNGQTTIITTTPVAKVQTSPTTCYTFDEKGEHSRCQIISAANGEFTGYYSWYIDGKDGANGVFKGKNFFSDTLFAELTYMQEGVVQGEEIVFLKKGDNLVQLIGEEYDDHGKMVLKDKSKLKAGNTFTKTDCAQIEKEFDNIKTMEKDKVFMYPDPVLTLKEEKTARNLEGDWQSKEDPKAGVLIGKGQFTFIYDGKNAEPAMRYIYYPTCPKDCNPMAKIACLKIIGQDDVCYNIVKVDGKSLNLSQIGGTGNTNHYVRKK